MLITFAAYNTILLISRKEHSKLENYSRRDDGCVASPMTMHGMESSSALTAEALKALGEEGSQVLVYSGSHSRPMLFNGSNSKAPIGLFADDSDIFADVDPDRHMLIVQHRESKTGFRRPTEDMVRIIKAVITRCRRTNGIFSEAFTRTSLKRKQKEPHVKPLPSTINNSSLIVMKKVSRKLRPSNRRPDPDLDQPPPSIEQMMKQAREKDEGCAMGAVFVEWKLSTPAFSALPLVPSLHNDLPWFYMADPGTGQGHLFGNIAARQSFLIANSDLQSSNRLLYSKDGWLLLLGQDLLLCGRGRGSPKYSMFLLNPITGARIDLPGFYYPDTCAAFCTTSTPEGTRTPGVVICGFFTETMVRVYMARPGPGGAYSYWEEHPYVFKPGLLIASKPSMKMLLCGGSVYYFYNSVSGGCLLWQCLIFKLADLSWLLLTGKNLEHFVRYEPLEVEGKLVMVGHPQHFTSPLRGLVVGGLISIPFFRMEIIGDRFYWVEITELDEGRLWFIDRFQSFSVKVAGSGQKICWFFFFFFF
ncbi:hypothetical protein FCM35_KLT19674 [Carex littledalei]|uniref:KIB1-4 beta-propeller domain-containing protein n=1 Tax=Carex littledalei TaxID=544730 RepID=A0A833RBZ1_9POAL|nr:hypothetical protein FCM35_KLT19674 [Carex littledalei]